MSIQENHIKKSVSLYYWLMGKEFHVALKAYEFAKKIHSGLRKDGETPEFAHQVWIAQYARTLRIPDEDMESVIASALLHDTIEDDSSVSVGSLSSVVGPTIASYTMTLSKKYYEGGYKVGKYFPEYVSKLSENPIVATVKGIDRLHNLSTMQGVFSEEKIESYKKETREYYVPMLKNARKHFTKYEAVFENIKLNIMDKIGE